MRTAPTRDATLDIARGLAMGLVVLGHAIIGTGHALGETPVMRFMILMIYAAHMPFFFWLAGFLSKRLIACPLQEFLRRLWGRFLWPYLIWSTVLLALHFAFSAHTNTDVTQFRPWVILWKPPAVMWFLYVLTGALVALWGLYRLSNLAILGAGFFLLFAPYVGSEVPHQLRFVGLVFLGFGCGPETLLRLNTARLRWAGLFALALAVWVASDLALLPIPGYPARAWGFLPLMLAAPILLLWGAGIVERGALGRALAAGFASIGQNSMAIFVLHIVFTAGVRIGLIAVGVTNPLCIIFCATCAGVAAPWLLARGADRWHVAPVLGWASGR